MLVKEVILKYHQIIPFPWSLSKIKKAGFEPMQLARDIGEDLGRCEDKDTPTAKAVLNTLKDLGVMP